MFEGSAGGLTKPVEGFHTGGFNRNTWGVAMIGNFDDVAPTPIQIRTVGRLLGWRLACHGDCGWWRPLRSGRRLRRRDQDRGDVLPEWLFLGGWTVSQTAVEQVVGRPPRRRLSYRCVDRASHRDLHGGGGAHEHRIGATGTRIESSKFHGPVGARRIAWFGFILGLIPRPPVTVRALGAHTSGGTGQVASQRHQ
nr:N-acetylmuramoyl-L-alanine amidase [Mycobacterium tuberculosis]